MAAALVLILAVAALSGLFRLSVRTLTAKN